MNIEILDYYVTKIINEYRLGMINKKQAIQDIMDFGFTKNHAKDILEGK